MQIFKNMIQTWLLFGFLALVSGQIIYPDQYNMMTVDLGRASTSLSADYPALQVASNQPVQIDQQFDRKPASQFSTAKSVEEQFYPATTRIPLYSSTSPSASPQPMSETWGNHVKSYSIILLLFYYYSIIIILLLFTRNHDYLMIISYIFKSHIFFKMFI